MKDGLHGYHGHLVQSAVEVDNEQELDCAMVVYQDKVDVQDSLDKAIHVILEYVLPGHHGFHGQNVMLHVEKV